MPRATRTISSFGRFGATFPSSNSASRRSSSPAVGGSCAAAAAAAASARSRFSRSFADSLSFFAPAASFPLPFGEPLSVDALCC